MNQQIPTWLSGSNMSLNVPMSGYPNEQQMMWPQGAGYPHPMAYPNFLGKLMLYLLLSSQVTFLFIF